MAKAKCDSADGLAVGRGLDSVTWRLFYPYYTRSHDHSDVIGIARAVMNQIISIYTI